MNISRVLLSLIVCICFTSCERHRHKTAAKSAPIEETGDIIGDIWADDDNTEVADVDAPDGGNYGNDGGGDNESMDNGIDDFFEELGQFIGIAKKKKSL